MTKYWKIEQTDGGFSIFLEIHKLKEQFQIIEGAPCVFASRILGLTYPEYLRFVREYMGAKLVGRNFYYITVIFPDYKATKEFVKMLSLRVDRIFTEKRIKALEEELKSEH